MMSGEGHRCEARPQLRLHRLKGRRAGPEVAGLGSHAGRGLMEATWEAMDNLWLSSYNLRNTYG